MILMMELTQNTVWPTLLISMANSPLGQESTLQTICLLGKVQMPMECLQLIKQVNLLPINISSLQFTR
jgi:hypothetical protein